MQAAAASTSESVGSTKCVTHLNTLKGGQLELAALSSMRLAKGCR